jgi:LEA14-like dessication related protein
MKSPRFLLVLLGLGALVFGGCQSRSELGEITVSVVDLRPTGGTLFESQANLTLRFVNENIVPLGYTGATHKLYLNGSYIGKAVDNQPMGLAPTSTTTRDVTLLVENLALIRQLMAIRNEGMVTYRLESLIFSKQGDEKLQNKTETTGTLDLQGLTQ